MPLITTPSACPQAQPLFDSLDYHLVIASCFEDYHQARLHVDNLEQPRAAFLWLGHHGFLAGDFQVETFQETLSSVVLHEMLGSIRFYYPDEEWEAFIRERVLEHRDVKRELRQYYTCIPEDRGSRRRWPTDEISVGWLGMQALGQEFPIENHHLIEAEIVSSNPSFEAFLERGWGVCALHGVPGHISYAGWCLAENIVEGRCEVGIETLPSYRRQGVAHAMVDVFITIARESEFSQVGWHCWKDNIPSAKTALKAGFQLEREYPVLVTG